MIADDEIAETTATPLRAMDGGKRRGDLSLSPSLAGLSQA
jgi:hypothetical protein